ncbi:acetolactate synthase catalytic subunit [Mesorhizobium sp. M0317]|uniref:acetolactate synthase catalytic subunit n=1 Tax=Mesorhizobium sp. M0317 TaxID=2956935 RepID=UPI0033389502
MSGSVAQAIARALRRHGVEVVFGQSLPSAVILACEDVGIRQLSYRQENMGGAMADGYARVSGKTSIVAAQNGPAAALLVAPLSEALKASVAIVAIVQDVERQQVDRNAFQELDHLQLFSGCSKWVRRLLTADRAEDYVDMAFVAAGSGRPGPAVLLLPADLLRENAFCPLVERTSGLGRWPLDNLRPSDDAITDAAQLLAAARSPVVVAGGGATSAAASAALARLQENTHLPVITTNMGKGVVDETHTLSCGVLGSLNGPRSLGHYAQALLDEADVVLMVGTRTNQNGTDGWRNIPKLATLVQIDIDPQEIGRNYEALRLTGEAASTLGALCDCLEQLDLSKRQTKRPGLADRIAGFWRAFDKSRAALLSGDAQPIRPERVMAELQKLLTADTIVVADASYSSMWVVGQLRSTAARQRFISPRGLAGIGWGLPLAIGAKIARPDSNVVAVVGDGGFAHSWAELETLVRSRLAVTVVVLNNGVLAFQKHAEQVKFGAYTSACHFAPVDHAMIAAACGCKSLRVDLPADIHGALSNAMASDDPWLIEIMSDPDSHPALSLFGSALKDSRQMMPLPA